jgi:hypothetical protein
MMLALLIFVYFWAALTVGCMATVFGKDNPDARTVAALAPVWPIIGVWVIITCIEGN